ncbi:MAG: SRPBCC domain-containing protein [Pseudomonadota bacterium]
MTTDIEWVRIERSFDAAIETIWQAWTDAAAFQQWYGPRGMQVPVAELDVVEGGRRKVCLLMETPERTMKMWFVGEFREVSAPHRLVYTDSMSDEDGNILSPQSMGMPPDHPETTEVIVELSENDGRTVMTLTHVGVPAESGGAGGWSQAFDKLAERVEPAS